MKKFAIVSFVLLISLFGAPLHGGLASLVDGARLIRSAASPFVCAAANFVAVGPDLDRLAAGQTNEDIAREYPHAYEYISGELAKVGLDPARIRIIDNPQIFEFKLESERAVRMLSCCAPFACISDKGLCISLGEFEKELSLASTPGAESDILKSMKVILTHEISHLIHRDGCGMAGFVSDSFASTIAEVVGACFFDAGVSLLSSAVRFTATGLFSFYLKNRLRSACEFRADGEALERFRSQPSYLLAAAKVFTLHYAASRGESIWDDHPSILSRAVRFATAAGKNVTKEILSERLKTATPEEILSGKVFE